MFIGYLPGSAKAAAVSRNAPNSAVPGASETFVPAINVPSTSPNWKKMK